MAWDHLSVTKSHLVYIILGGFTSLFMICSTVIKERMYIGEATVATICGVIFGPHAANLINPFEWGNTDEITLEFSRIVLVVQCFAVGVELPKFYMERHWKSVVFLLVPVMAFGWLITGLFIFLLIPTLNYVDSLVVAACVTATDPVLASSVVGKGKFARRVPKHLRDLLSAESGCNDGMAFPFIYLALYLIQFNNSPKDVAFSWLVIVILYECIFGAIYGFVIGYIARRLIRWAHEHDLIDRESFLSFYFVLSLFCAGSGSILGLDDLLVGFAAGVGFSNDGWFSEKTEESHVSNVIDLLLNLSYFVYLGTIIPWEQFSAEEIGLTPWRLVCIALLVIFFRRIPIMLALKPVIPDLKNWREALFAGHFGPIGVGAIFVAILARAELQTQSTIPLDTLPTEEENENAILIKAVWPIVTFLVVASILVHGSSIAVFTLGKRINTLSITMSYTKDMGEDGPEWLRRLPRLSSVSKSQARSVSSADEDFKLPIPPGSLPNSEPVGGFLKRVRAEDGRQSRASSNASRRKKKRWGSSSAGGPISQSAIFPQKRRPEISVAPVSPTDSEFDPITIPEAAIFRSRDPEKLVDLESQTPSPPDGPTPILSRPPSHVEVFGEGPHLIIEDQDGEVLAVTTSHMEDQAHPEGGTFRSSQDHVREAEEVSPWSIAGLKSRYHKWLMNEKDKRKGKDRKQRKHEPARAYQYGNTLIVEDEDGEVVKRYELPPQTPEEPHTDFVSQGLKYMGMGSLVGEKEPSATGPSTHAQLLNWSGFGQLDSRPNALQPTLTQMEEEDDRHIRFRFGDGERMTKDDFIRAIQERTREDEAPEGPGAPGRVQDPTEAPRERVTEVPSQMLTASGAAGPGLDTDYSDTTKTESRSDSPLTVSKPPIDDRPVDRARSGSSASTAQSPGRARSGSSASAVLIERAMALVGSSSSNNQAETAADQRRRALETQYEGAVGEMEVEVEVEETPAERRRREIALGMMGDLEDDSDDDNTERVVPRRSIRWSNVPIRR